MVRLTPLQMFARDTRALLQVPSAVLRIAVRGNPLCVRVYVCGCVRVHLCVRGACVCVCGYGPRLQCC